MVSGGNNEIVIFYCTVEFSYFLFVGIQVDILFVICLVLFYDLSHILKAVLSGRTDVQHP